MPTKLPGSTYIKGGRGVIVPQESTGELQTIAGGKHGGEFVPLAVDVDGNPKGYTERDLFSDILCELRKINLHLSMITDAEFKENDTR